MSHTKEPWKIVDKHDQPNSDFKLFTINSTKPPFYEQAMIISTLTPDNAFRIVACVNACAGMIEPEKEIKAMREQIADLQSNLWPFVVVTSENTEETE